MNSSSKKNQSTITNKLNMAEDSDIISLILEDHKPLKKLIKVMKDSDRSMQERLEAFKEFAPLLITHAKPEEEVLYSNMKGQKELREEAFEGDVEHRLADEMLNEAMSTTDKDVWGAKVKVLAELVEHHIEEEEEELLPDFKKYSSPGERKALGESFVALKGLLEDEGFDDTPAVVPTKDPKAQVRHGSLQ